MLKSKWKFIAFIFVVAVGLSACGDDRQGLYGTGNSPILTLSSFTGQRSTTISVTSANQVQLDYDASHIPEADSVRIKVRKADSEEMISDFIFPGTKDSRSLYDILGGPSGTQAVIQGVFFISAQAFRNNMPISEESMPVTVQIGIDNTQSRR